MKRLSYRKNNARCNKYTLYNTKTEHDVLTYGAITRRGIAKN